MHARLGAVPRVDRETEGQRAGRLIEHGGAANQNRAGATGLNGIRQTLERRRIVRDTKLALGDTDKVLDGDIDAFIHAFLVWKKTGKLAGDDKDPDD